MPVGIVFALAGALLSAPAEDAAVKPLNLSKPTSGYTYYNRLGADIAEHDKDVLRCVEHSASVRSVDDQLGGGSGMGLLGGLLGDAIANATDRGVKAASIENCMVVYGWRVVRLDDAEGQALSVLPPAELRSKIGPWIGATQPHGEVVRVWQNDAANGSVNHFALRPGRTKRGQLGVLAAAAAVAGTASSPVALPDDHKGKIDPRWKQNSLKPEELTTAPAGSGIVIVGISGIGSRGNGLLFRRISPDPNLRASALDHAPDEFFAGGGALGGGSRMLAFALPPGRWRIAWDVNGLMVLNYCLGSPSFELKAGEVVYAGRLDMKSEKLQPDVSLAPVQQWLGATQAVRAVKPAVYTNGSRGPCGPNSIYAIEFEGAAFEPGYELGSRASKGD